MSQHEYRRDFGLIRAEAATTSRFTVVMVARLAEESWEAFLNYESVVLPILDRYGGLCERRLRAEAHPIEVHVISFPDAVQYANFRAYSQRASTRGQVADSDIDQEILVVRDVDETLPRDNRKEA